MNQAGAGKSDAGFSFGRVGRAGQRPACEELGSGAAAQQPRQIFLSRAFISASSAPIESMLLAASDFGTGAVRIAGLAAAEGKAGFAFLS
jgi:hypothetical protein